MIIKINKSLNTQLSSYENFASLQNKIIKSNDNTIDLIINNDKSFSYTFWFLKRRIYFKLKCGGICYD